MSDQKTRLVRFGMWGMVIIGLPGLVAAFLGARQIIPLALGVAGGFFFLACVLMGALIGVQNQRKARQQREVENYGSMLVIIAAQLKDQDDTVLERIVSKGGPAGEAATMVLEGKREKGRGKRETE